MSTRGNLKNHPQPETQTPEPIGSPDLVIINRQRSVRVDIHELREHLIRALPLCLAAPGTDAPVLLHTLTDVSVCVVSPRVMARVHREFLQIDGPTDVITFPYGEILICASVALENAERFRVSVQDEIVLYGIHGLLHLNGYDDISPESARRMHTMQVNLLKAVRN